ncbi:MAG: 4-(cytidine 5'-diphospho)-2-C-methyl-D-erythritol kinase [Pseudaminobacter sp.]
MNLALHITGRRADGYHLLESLVVFTRFGDRAEMRAAGVDSFEIDGPFGEGLSIDGDNLVIRARDALREAVARQLRGGSRPTLPPSVLPDISPSRGEIMPSSASRPIFNQPEVDEAAERLISPLEGEMSGRTEGGNVRCSVSGLPVAIRLDKHLPLASGIGGGSSDAAATLRALNRLWRCNLTPGALAHIGQSLGADVPMCLAATPLIARGIGEIIEPVADFLELHLVLVNAGVEVPTPAVFAALAQKENPPLPPLPAHLYFDSLRSWLAASRNDLEAPATAIAPAIAESLAALRANDAAFARMSGSGATCFGLFETQAQAQAAAETIGHGRPGWFVAATSSRR